MPPSRLPDLERGHVFPKHYRMPVPMSKVRVILVTKGEEYGVPPASPCNCITTKRLIKEYNRTSGRVPAYHHDFRSWKKQGVLHLTPKTRSEKELTHICRYFSMARRGLVFCFLDFNLSCLKTYCMDGSHYDNFFIASKFINGSDAFRHIDFCIKELGDKPINWAL